MENNNHQAFSFFDMPIKNITPCNVFTLSDAYHYITGHQASQSTYQLRCISDKEYAKEFKKQNFKYCTFSGLFHYRNDSALIQHSGLLCIDFDHLNDVNETKKILLDDTYLTTELMFVSPSGNGIKWVISIDINQYSHSDCFCAISNYLFATYSLKADPQCKNVSRACFLPHDPFCYINPKHLNNG